MKAPKAAKRTAEAAIFFALLAASLYSGETMSMTISKTGVKGFSDPDQAGNENDQHEFEVIYF